MNSIVHTVLRRISFAAVIGASWCFEHVLYSGETEATVDGLVRQLDSEDQSERKKALASLRQLGPRAVTAIPAILKASGKKHLGAGDTLASMGKEAVPYLTKGLEHDDPWVRADCAYALWRIGVGPPKTVQALVRKLGDEDIMVRLWSLNFLREVSPASIPVESLVALLKDKGELGIHHMAAETLGAMGQKASAAVPALIECLEDNDCGNAVAALGKIGSPATGDLVKALGAAKEPVHQQRIVLALRGIGPPASKSVPAVIELTRKDHHDLRICAILALGQIGGDHSERCLRAMAKRNLNAETKSVVEEALDRIAKMKQGGAKADEKQQSVQPTDP